MQHTKRYVARWTAEDQEQLLTRLLSSAVGIRRSREISAGLLRRFGSLPAAIAAPSYRMQEVAGVGPATARLLSTVMEATQQIAKERICDAGPILTSWPQLLEYCHTAMAFESIEQFRVLFLDKKNRLIADEVQQVGTVDYTPIYPREVIRRTLELSAISLILVHNHPSGDPAPSSADLRMTHEIITVAKPMGILVHDHIIIGRCGHVSMRAMKLLNG